MQSKFVWQIGKEVSKPNTRWIISANLAYLANDSGLTIQSTDSVVQPQVNVAYSRLGWVYSYRVILKAFRAFAFMERA